MIHLRFAIASASLGLLSACACSAAAQEAVIYSFYENFGTNPISGLAIDHAGNLYGTTSIGSVYELTPGSGGAWTANVLSAISDSLIENGVILDGKGNLYGTTEDAGCGSVFVLIKGPGSTWEQENLYYFNINSNDACEPRGDLVFDKMGNLYGTTGKGGDNNQGAVFELVPQTDGTWEEKVLWSFAGSPDDGSAPLGGVALDAEGNLYGTTASGGPDDDGGTVFELLPHTDGPWSEKVLYSFCASTACSDGSAPETGVILDSTGNLYGTTLYGGKYGPNNGTVFKLSPNADGTWTETVIHNFAGGVGDGVHPRAGLIFGSRGNLFGTTETGGAGGAGIVVELSPEDDGTWSEKVLFDFGSQPRGAAGSYPEGLVADASGNFFGTANGGGEYGKGAAFEIFNPDRAGTPAFSIPAGTYAAPKSVAITDYTTGAAIYYTTDGDDPTTDSIHYEEPIHVTENETIKAIAVASGLSEAEIATAEYKIAAAVPELSLKPGTFTKVQFVTINDTTPHSTIYYTTNGDTPTTSSARYSVPIRVAKTETIKAIAVAYRHAPSAPATATYTIHLPTATPVFSPAAGKYSSPLTVHISDATSGATIYYTTNGTDPTTSSTRYTAAGIKVSSKETINAIAVAPGRFHSAIATASYNIP